MTMSVKQMHINLRSNIMTVQAAKNFKGIISRGTWIEMSLYGRYMVVIWSLYGRYMVVVWA